jgi:GTP-binding protein EngB required for normal cell division
MFYFTDWNFYNIDKNLDHNKIYQYYRKRIDSENIKYITMTTKHDELENKISRSINEKIRKKLLLNGEWRLLFEFGSSALHNNSGITLYGRN